MTRNMKTTPKISPPRRGRSKASLLLRWAWLMPLGAVPFSTRDYSVLQLLSAEVLFTTLFVAIAVLAVVLALVLVAVGYASFRGVVMLASMGH